MNTLTATELGAINGGKPSELTLLAEHLAADGLAHMDSLNPIKSGLGTLLAAGAGWLFAFSNAYDEARSMWGW